jgi:hypothetical protein
MNTGALSAAIVSATSFICDVQMMGKSSIPTTDARQAIEDASKPAPLLCAGAHSALAAAYAVLQAAQPPEPYPSVVGGPAGAGDRYSLRLNEKVKARTTWARSIGSPRPSGDTGPVSGGESGGKSGASRGHVGIRILVITVSY